MIDVKEISQKIIDGKLKKIKRYPQYNVRASDVGHPCERYLVYSITNWADRALYDVGLQFVFEGGDLVENLALKDFEDAGFKIYRPEPTSKQMLKNPTISGRRDVRVDFGNGIPKNVEIKGLNKYDFDSLNCVEDFFNSKKTHLKKYPAQLMTYLYMDGEEDGFFYLKSLPGFQFKWIYVKLDFDYMDSILKKAQRIEEHVRNKTLPPQIDDYSVCERCGFLHLCLPSLKRQPMEFIDDEDLEQKLIRWDELKPISKEYEELDKEIKKSFEGHEKLMIGNFIIQGQLIERKAYVPKPVEASSYWKYKVAKLSI